MSDWSYLGLPYANRIGYAYTKDMRIIRSEMASALPDQSQLRNPGKKTFKISWNLTPEELNVATLYLLEFGFDWFEIELVSEQGFVLHEVRLIEKFDTVPISGTYYKVTATVETKIEPASCTPITCDTPSIDQLWPCGPPDVDLTITDAFTTQGSVPTGQILNNVAVIASGPYPIEVEESITSHGWIVNGWELVNQIEAYKPSALLTNGQVIDILVPVDFTQYPDKYIPAAQLLAGLLYEVYTPAAFSQYPDKYIPASQLLSGTLIDEPPNVTITNPDELMSSTAVLVNGTLE